jgi:hypothetical protein
MRSVTVEYPAEMQCSIIGFYIAEAMDNINTLRLSFFRGASEAT